MSTIRARILVLHRKEQYPGQLAPEFMLIADQWMLEENPQWFDDEVRKVKQSIGDDANAWATIEVELDHEAVLRALYPASETITAHVLSADGAFADATGDSQLRLSAS